MLEAMITDRDMPLWLRLRRSESSRALAMLAWFVSRGATGAGQWPGDPEDSAKQIKAREEFDAWWSGR